jgi:SP family general alpha glucoside:H+ symporter-like MFS transporter
MVGIIILIFAFIPESPWWLVSKGKIDKAAKVLTRCNGNVEGYSVDEQIVCHLSLLIVIVFERSFNIHQEVMTATIAEERLVAERNSEEGTWAVFQGRNRLRFCIAAWPKITQQLVGLSVFNTYATYFCEYSSSMSSFTLLISP